MSTLVVLDDVPIAPEVIAGAPCGGAVLLTLSPRSEVVAAVERLLRRDGVHVEVRSAAGLLDAVAPLVREEYRRVVRDAPRQFRRGGRTLLEALAFDGGRLSLWWLNELSGKRSDVYETFTRLCQLEVVMRLAADKGVDALCLVSDDPDFWAVLASYCRIAGLAFLTPAPAAGSERRRLAAEAVRAQVRLVRSLARLATQGLVARVIGPRVRRPGATVFFSHYPSLWRRRGTPADEKYGAVPEVLASRGEDAVYACTLGTDGAQQVPTLRAYLAWCLMLARGVGPFAGRRVDLVDAYSTVSDFARVLSLARLTWSYERLVRDASFCALWRYRGVDFSPYVRRELRAAGWRTAGYVFQMFRFRRYLRAVRPACLVTYLFEFCYGRALIYAARSASVPIVMGVQHGPITRRKALYYQETEEVGIRAEAYVDRLPLPDHVLVEGEAPRERLLEAGYPPGVVVAAGAPRVASAPPAPRARHPGARPATVLVVFGQHDGPAIIAACRQAMAVLRGCHFVLKLHPRSGFGPKRIEDALVGRDLASTWEVARGTVEEQLGGADVVVATYSSVGMEAAAAGHAVVCLLLPNVVNGSPLLDEPVPGVLVAAGPEELAPAVERALGRDQSTDRGAGERWFSATGQDAEQVWADRILELLGHRAAGSG